MRALDLTLPTLLRGQAPLRAPTAAIIASLRRIRREIQALTGFRCAEQPLFCATHLLTVLFPDTQSYFLHLRWRYELYWLPDVLRSFSVLSAIFRDDADLVLCNVASLFLPSFYRRLLTLSAKWASYDSRLLRLQGLRKFFWNAALKKFLARAASGILAIGSVSRLDCPSRKSCEQNKRR